MLQRNQLVPVTDEDQGTGSLLRKYLRNLKRKELQPPGYASHTTLERMQRLNDLSMEETRIVPRSEAVYLPRVLRYREVNKPLELLYASVIETIRLLDAIPDMLFISKVRIPELKRETERIQHRQFDDYFVYYSGQGKLEYIPVHPIETLPEVLGYPLGEAAHYDEIFAIVNCPPPVRHHLTA